VNPGATPGASPLSIVATDGPLANDVIDNNLNTLTLIPALTNANNDQNVNGMVTILPDKHADSPIAAITKHFPAAPTDLSIVHHSNDGASLTWTNALGAARFLIQISRNGGSDWSTYATIEIGPSNGKKITFNTGNLPAGSYLFQVVVVNAKGRSVPSNTATLKISPLTSSAHQQIFEHWGEANEDFGIGL
jgi:hypothetical protein